MSQPTGYQVQCRNCEDNTWYNIGPIYNKRADAKEECRFHFHNGVDWDSLRILEVEETN